MPVSSHLKSLQAVEIAMREGSLTAAAARLGITHAAVGQRIRALEDFLGTDLLLRGRSGLQPTPELERALDDLRAGFAALDRVTEKLDFQRVSEIHIVADGDLADLWLLPRLAAFRADHPNILFCVNGEGDAPVRLGAPDCRIEYGSKARGTELFRDCLIPVCGPDNVRRIADWDTVMDMEGMPLLHMEAQRDDPERPGWRDWFAAFGHRREGHDRGVHYRLADQALDAVRQEVGFLICGYALVQAALAKASVIAPFPPDQSLEAPFAYRVHIRPEAAARPQFQRFHAWLVSEALATRDHVAAFAGR
jgi:LysR family glycine cleavage system transcriptional activator